MLTDRRNRPAPNFAGRYFIRCLTCLTVVAFEWTNAATSPETSLANATCNACAGKLEVMGRVHFDRLRRMAGYESVCDERCTSARGPSCSCVCGGANHGTGAVVEIIVDAGAVPRIDVPNTAEVARRVAELEMLRAQWQEVWTASGGEGLAIAKASGRYLQPHDYSRFRELDCYRDAWRKALHLRTPKGRAKSLAAAIADLAKRIGRTPATVA